MTLVPMMRFNSRSDPPQFDFSEDSAKMLESAISSNLEMTAEERIEASPHTVTGLTNGNPYYFMVTAHNAGGSMPASSEALATPANNLWGSAIWDTATWAP